VEKYCTTGQATDDNINGLISFACCIPKATDTHSRYVILVAFPRQKWFGEHASMSNYTCIACLVKVTFIFHTVFNAHPPHLPSAMTYI